MASSNQTPPVRRLSHLERVPNELGVNIVKRIPLFMQVKVGQVSRKCNAFRQMTTDLQKTLYIYLTNDDERHSYERGPFLVRAFQHETDNVNSRHEVLPDETLRSKLYSSGLIINVDGLDVTSLEAMLIQIGNIFPNLNEIIFMSKRTTVRELQFINQALIQWSTGLQVLKLYMESGNWIFESTLRRAKEYQWRVLLDKLQTLTNLESLTIDSSEPILGNYRHVKSQPNKPLFPVLAQLREFYLKTFDHQDLIYSSFERFAVGNPRLERVGLKFYKQDDMYFTNYARLGQDVTSRFTHFFSQNLPADQLNWVARSFSSLMQLILTFNQQTNYKDTMAHLSQLANLVELILCVNDEFRLVNKQIEANALVTPITAVKILTLNIGFNKHSIMTKLYIHQMFPNVERLYIWNVADCCKSKHCTKVRVNFTHDEGAFYNCLSRFLDPLKPLIRRVRKENFSCTYMRSSVSELRDKANEFAGTFCESIQ